MRLPLVYAFTMPFRESLRYHPYVEMKPDSWAVSVPGLGFGRIDKLYYNIPLSYARSELFHTPCYNPLNLTLGILCGSAILWLQAGDEL